MTTKFKVGYYIKPFGNDYLEVSLDKVLKNIAGTNFKLLINEARDLYKKNKIEEYTLFKSKLPAITFSGIFSPTRTASNIQEYSALIVLDLDKIGEDLQIIKQKLFEDQYVIAIWISPSGDGLKFLISTISNNSIHKQAYKSAVEYFTNTYNVKVDKSGSDVSRLCFISHDSDLLFKTEHSIFDKFSIQTEQKIKKQAVQKTDKCNDIKISTISNRVLINNDYDKKIFKDICYFLKKRNISITNTYENWVRVAFAISNTFCYHPGQRYFMDLCRLDGANHNEELSEKLIHSCYSNGTSLSSFSTILYLAQSHGFIINYNKKKVIKVKKNYF